MKVSCKYSIPVSYSIKISCPLITRSYCSNKFTNSKMKKTNNSEYERRLELSIMVPIQFSFLSKVMQVPTRQILYDFVCNLG